MTQRVKKCISLLCNNSKVRISCQQATLILVATQEPRLMVLQMRYSGSRFLEKGGTSRIQGQGVPLSKQSRNCTLPLYPHFIGKSQYTCPTFATKDPEECSPDRVTHTQVVALLLWKKTRAQFGRTISFHPNSILDLRWTGESALSYRERKTFVWRKPCSVKLASWTPYYSDCPNLTRTIQRAGIPWNSLRREFRLSGSSRTSPWTQSQTLLAQDSNLFGHLMSINVHSLGSQNKFIIYSWGNHTHAHTHTTPTIANY